MGLSKSSAYFTAHSTFFPWVISFVRPRRRLSSAPTAIRNTGARRGCQGWPSLRRPDALQRCQATPLQPRARRQTGAIGAAGRLRLRHVAAILICTHTLCGGRDGDDEVEAEPACSAPRPCIRWVQRPEP
jgi:hypothetical protein